MSIVLRCTVASFVVIYSDVAKKTVAMSKRHFAPNIRGTHRHSETRRGTSMEQYHCYMFARAHMDNLTVLLRKLSYGFNLRLQNSDNSSLKAVYELHSFMMSDLNARWRNSFEIRRLLYSFSICVSYMLEYKLSMICVADRYKDLFVYSFVLNNISPHSC